MWSSSCSDISAIEEANDAKIVVEIKSLGDVVGFAEIELNQITKRKMLVLILFTYR